jgi:hypothetical protein
MAHLLDFIQKHDVETVLTTLYVLVDDAYPLACAALGWKGRERGKEPLFTDSEVLTIVYYAAMRRWVGRSSTTTSKRCFPT